MSSELRQLEQRLNMSEQSLNLEYANSSFYSDVKNVRSFEREIDKTEIIVPQKTKDKANELINKGNHYKGVIIGVVVFMVICICLLLFSASKAQMQKNIKDTELAIKKLEKEIVMLESDIKYENSLEELEKFCKKNGLKPPTKKDIIKI